MLLFFILFDNARSNLFEWALMFSLPSSICQAKPRMRPLACVMFVMPRYIFRYNFIRQLLDFRRAVGAALAEFFGFCRPQQANFLGVSLLRFLIVEIV